CAYSVPPGWLCRPRSPSRLQPRSGRPRSRFSYGFTHPSCSGRVWTGSPAEPVTVRITSQDRRAVSYTTLKLIHVSAVTVSFFGFAARGLGAFRDASWVRHPLARTLPHMVDTVLLLSAVGMLYIIRLSPLEQPWLRAKIIGLLVYIALGSLALRPTLTGRPLQLRRVSGSAWVGALVVFGYIISVAVTKNP